MGCVQKTEISTQHQDFIERMQKSCSYFFLAEEGGFYIKANIEELKEKENVSCNELKGLMFIACNVDLYCRQEEGDCICDENQN